MRFIRSHEAHFMYHKYYILAYKKNKFSREINDFVSKSLSLGMPNYKISDYFNAKPNILIDSDWIFVAHDINTRQAIGVLSIRWIDGKYFKNSINIKTILIATRFQRTQLIRHFFSCMLKALYTENRLVDSFSIKTTNPISYMSLKIFSRIPDTYFFPNILNPEGNNINFLVIKEMAGIISPNQFYSIEKSIYLNGNGGVPNDFYPQFPISKCSYTNNYFKEHVWPNNRLLAILFFESNKAKNKLQRVLGV